MPSLSVAQGGDGRALLMCHAGCTLDAVCEALGIKVADLFEPPRGSTREGHPSAEAAREAATRKVQEVRGASWRLTQAYDYSDAGGRERMRVLRFESPDGSEKTFRPIHPDGGVWSIGDPRGPLPLYRLPAVVVESEVAVCEGEKAADAAAAIGLPSTTAAHGAKAERRSDWTPLAGRGVTILPDNDDPGRAWAQRVAEILVRLNPPSIVRIAALPGVPVHGDIVEFIAAQREAGRADHEIREAVLAVAADAAPFVGSGSLPNGGEGGAAGASGGFVGRGNGRSGEFPEPQPLPDGLPPVLPFDPDVLLPRPLRGWVKDIARRMQCPVDFLGVAAVVVLATVVGRKVGIRPKRRDDWLVVPNLWGVCIGPPSVMKTPAIREALKPLRRLEVDAKKEFERRVSEQLAAQFVQEEKRKHSRKEVSEAVKQGDPDAEALAVKLFEAQPRPVTRVRHIVNDATVEKLGEILNENVNGVLVFRDELTGLLKSLDKPGHECDRAFYLEAWDGLGSFTYDRIGRGTIDIEAAILSLLGGIQPARLRSYLTAAVEHEGDDGLVSRFQLAVWPDVAPKWKNVDEYPDAREREKAYALIRRLQELRPAQFGAGEGGEGTPALRFAGEAQEVFTTWRTKLENRIRSDEEHPALQSHFAKYRSLVPALALLFHLAEEETNEVGKGALEMAIRWEWFLSCHARRIYSVAVNSEVHSAQVLAAKIRKGQVLDGFVERDIYRKGWAGLSKRETPGALELLVDLEWLRAVEEKTGGRPSTRYWINPRVHELPTERTAKTDESPREEWPGAAERADRTDRSGHGEAGAPGTATDRTDERASGGFGSGPDSDAEGSEAAP